MNATLPALSSPAVGFEVPLEMLAACHGRVQQQNETLVRLRQALQQVRDGTAATLDDADVHGFVQLYAQHIAREETELLPMAARLLSDAELDRIGLAMRARRGLDCGPAA